MTDENDIPRRRAFTKTDKRGRSAGRDRKKNPKTRPKDCGFEQFAWLPKELLETCAWTALSINGYRLIFRILLEHLAQGGVQNGELIVTHDDLEAYGLSRNCIAEAIREAEFLGLIRARRGPLLEGRRPPTVFRLTWMGGWSRSGEMIDPSNEWKGVNAEAIAKWRAMRYKANKNRRQRRAKNRSDPQV